MNCAICGRSLPWPSVAAGAERVRLSQPTVSRQVAMEQGLVLSYRGGRGGLTPGGTLHRAS